jgi:hypothetical protein
LSRDAYLGIELIAPTGIHAAFYGQELESNALAKLEIVGTVDFAHASSPQ